MRAGRRVELESLLSEAEFEQYEDIRVKELPKKRDKLGDGGFGEVSLFKFQDGNLWAGKKLKVGLLSKSQNDECKMKEVPLKNELNFQFKILS